MTFGQLSSQVHSAMRQYTAGNAGMSMVDRDMTDMWMQAAIYQLDADLGWTQDRVQVLSVVDQRRYTLDSAIRRILLVTYDGAELLPLLAAEDVVKQNADDTTGTPIYYSWFASELSLYPVPNTAALTIELWTIKAPTALATDAAVPTLPLHTHHLLVTHALYQAWQYIGEMDRSARCEEMYMAGMHQERGNYINARGIVQARSDSRAV